MEEFRVCSRVRGPEGSMGASFISVVRQAYISERSWFMLVRDGAVDFRFFSPRIHWPWEESLTAARNRKILRRVTNGWTKGNLTGFFIFFNGNSETRLGAFSGFRQKS